MNYEEFCSDSIFRPRQIDYMKIILDCQRVTDNPLCEICISSFNTTLPRIDVSLLDS